MIQPIPKPPKREPKAWRPLKRKRIKHTGKMAEKWLMFRAQYLADHPPDYKGEYRCWICTGMVHWSEVTLDHIIPRSRAPELRFEPSNIDFAHALCNTMKGSRVFT